MGLILQDSNSNLWNLQVDDNGDLSTLSVSSGTPSSVSINDLGSLTSWLLTVDTSGVLTPSSTSFNGAYPNYFILASIVGSTAWSIVVDSNGDIGTDASLFARPSSDVTLQNWTDEAGGTSNIYRHINETVPDDTNYIKSSLAPSSQVYVTKLSSVTDPLSSTGHKIHFRLEKNAAGGKQIDLTLQLRQGYTNEGSQGTLIATVAVTGLGSSWAQSDYTLSGSEADAITDYTNLYLRLVANQVG